MRNIILSMFAVMCMCSSCFAKTEVEVLEPQAFIDAAESDSTAVILDVRRPSEYEVGHLADAVNIDWLDQDAFLKKIPALDKGKTYYIYCRSGRRSNSAAVKLQQYGFKVFDMKGGILQWMAEKRPVVK